MYYYIMEPPRGKTAVWQEKVKDILGNLGIAGETVSPSSARTIEELASLGVVKGYSTIVAVGSEGLANKVVSAIINQKDKADVVLGVIPNDFNSLIAQKIGVKDLLEACEALKFRKLKTTDACLIEPNKYFLTEAVIESSTAEMYLTLDTVKAGLPFNKMVINPGIELTVYDHSSQNQSTAKFFNWILGRQEERKDIYTSFFHSKKIKIEVLGKNIPVKVNDETVARTPIICQNRPRVLKIIVARGNISSQK